MLLMMLVSQLMPALLQLMLLLVMFGMPDPLPTLGLLIPGPQVLLLMDILMEMVMPLTMGTQFQQLTDTLMPTTDGEKNKQSETNPKNLIVILCSLT